MKKEIEEFKKGKLPEQVGAVFGCVAAMVLPLTRQHQPEAETLAASLVNNLPLESYLSNPALFAVGAFLFMLPIFGAKFLGEQVALDRGALIGSVLGGVGVNALLWGQYFQG